MRSIPEQVWPALAKPPQTQPEIGVGEVGVGADDLRVLAAELEHRALQLLGADLADLAADLDRAGEEDLAAPSDSHSAWPTAPPPWTARTRPSGRPAFSNDLADPLAEQRGQAGRLEDDAVAGHQRDRHLAEGDRPGVVPGRDHADDADRLVGELAPSWSGTGPGAWGSARRRGSRARRRRTSAGRRSSGRTSIV